MRPPAQKILREAQRSSCLKCSDQAPRIQTIIELPDQDSCQSNSCYNCKVVKIDTMSEEQPIWFTAAAVRRKARTDAMAPKSILATWNAHFVLGRRCKRLPFLFFSRPTPSWLPPGRYTRSIVAKDELWLSCTAVNLSIATKVLVVDQYAVQYAVPARKPTQTKPQKQTGKPKNNKPTTKKNDCLSYLQGGLDYLQGGLGVVDMQLPCCTSSLQDRRSCSKKMLDQ